MIKDTTQALNNMIIIIIKMRQSKKTKYVIWISFVAYFTFSGTRKAALYSPPM